MFQLADNEEDYNCKATNLLPSNYFVTFSLFYETLEVVATLVQPYNFPTNIKILIKKM